MMKILREALERGDKDAIDLVLAIVGDVKVVSLNDEQVSLVVKVQNTAKAIAK